MTLSVLALAPGLLLAAVRYGGGLDRVTLSSIRAWGGPPELALPLEPWYWVPAVLLAYEPLVLALGVAGLVLALRRWSDPDRAGFRLMTVWTVVGMAITLMWLRRDPAALLLVITPLAMLGGIATAAATRHVTAVGIQRTGLALLPLVPALGYALVNMVRWANFQRIYGDEAAAVGLVLIGGVVAALGLVYLLKSPPAFALLVVAWIMLGGLSLHAMANAAFHTGSEFLQASRTLPEVEAIVRDVDRTSESGEPVWIERRLRLALAWQLRAHPINAFVETPPGIPAVMPAGIAPVDDPASPQGAPITEHWLPSELDLVGVLRWWVFRTPWGEVERQRAAVLP